MRLFHVLLLVFAATPALGDYGRADAPRDIHPLELGELFCAARIAGDMAPLERYFAPKLERVLTAADDPTAVPWQGRDARPTACSVEVVNGFDDTIGVLVAVSYVAADASWTDVLNLERTPDSWWLNNVFYEGGGNLRFRLFEQQAQ
jgi:hypothetical protein